MVVSSSMTIEFALFAIFMPIHNPHPQQEESSMLTVATP